MHDAFRDAELCATALDEAFTGASAFDDRHGPPTRPPATPQVLPMYELTTQLATLQPPPPDLQQLLGAIARQPGRRWTASPASSPGVTSPAEFFSEENVGQILAGTR